MQVLPPPAITVDHFLDLSLVFLVFKQKMISGYSRLLWNMLEATLFWFGFSTLCHRMENCIYRIVAPERKCGIAVLVGRKIKVTRHNKLFISNIYLINQPTGKKTWWVCLTS